MNEPKKNLSRYIARVVALIWAGWWCFFGIACGLSEGLGLIGVIIHISVPGLVFLLSAVIAWRWELIGGIVLTAEGLIISIWYPLFAHSFPPSVIVSTLAILALPPLISGIIFLFVYRQNHIG